MRKLNIITGLLFFVFGLAIFINTFFFKQTLISDNYLGAAFFPRLIAVCMMLFSAFLIFSGIKVPKDPQKEASEIQALFNTEMLRPALGAVLLLIYLPLIQILGFFFTTLLLFVGILRLVKVKTLSYYIIAPVFVGVIYGIFRYVFLVQLPEGFIGF